MPEDGEERAQDQWSGDAVINRMVETLADKNKDAIEGFPGDVEAKILIASGTIKRLIDYVIDKRVEADDG